MLLSAQERTIYFISQVSPERGKKKNNGKKKRKRRSLSLFFLTNISKKKLIALGILVFPEAFPCSRIQKLLNYVSATQEG